MKFVPKDSVEKKSASIQVTLKIVAFYIIIKWNQYLDKLT